MNTRKTPDTTTPGIDKQSHGFLRNNLHDQDIEHEMEMKAAVEKDREFYDSPENPGKNYNINDQAYSQSSPEDFVKTTSAFHSANIYNPPVDDTIPKGEDKNVPKI